MRSNKPYTNVTFTKRVDQDGGTHRPEKGRRGRLVCERCGAVYFRRRWIPPTDERAPIMGAMANRVTCPACAGIAKGLVGGYLTLEGAFVARHFADLEHLLKNEAARAAEDNPLAQIANWDVSVPGTITVTTTTEHLVERLGHAVHRAFDGTIDYGFSHGNKFARATWHRD